MPEPMTLREIAKSEGVSHKYIVEVLNRALRKMRKVLIARGIITADDLI